MRAELERWLALLALQRGAWAPTPRTLALALLALHLAGLTALWVVFHVPSSVSFPLAALSLGLLLSPQLVDSIRRRHWRVQAGVLSPLLPVYAVLSLRLILKYGLGWGLPTFAGGEPINLVAALLTTENILLAALAYVALIYVVQFTPRAADWTRGAALGLVSLTPVWAVWEYVGHRTAGVTGSDPYAYAQMGVDWVQHGVPLHEFPLFAGVVALDLPYFAAVHVGYHLPLQDLHVAPSVWPTGVSAFLGLAYRVVGEAGLYLVVPLFGLLSLIALWLIARRNAHPQAALVAALAVLLLATSVEQVNRLLIPMADVPSQFFSLLAVGLALYAPPMARNRVAALMLLGAACGVTFGLAYWIRHTQLLVGAALLLAVWGWERVTRRERLAFTLVLGLGALLTALPDLLYHQQVFGGILNVESEELQYYSAGAWANALGRVFDGFILPQEFGFIWPLTLLGALRMARAQFRLFAVLLAWLAAVTAIHVPYSALRLRDLLGEFPPLVWWTAWGAVGMLVVGSTNSIRTDTDGQIGTGAVPPVRRNVSLLMRVVAVSFVLLALSLRTQTTLARTLTDHSAGLGYMLTAERAAFDQIGSATPGNAVIAATLSSGPLDLYARRATIRPNVWTPAQFDRFLSSMQTEGRAVYLLYDSPDLRPLRDGLLAAGRLRAVRQYPALTFFGDREPDAGTLYAVVPGD